MKVKTKVFAIWDEKAQAFLPPFFLPTAGMAIRAISDLVNSPGHQFGVHPGDYTLFELADFDDATGEFAKDKIGLESLGLLSSMVKFRGIAPAGAKE